MEQRHRANGATYWWKHNCNQKQPWTRRDTRTRVREQASEALGRGELGFLCLHNEVRRDSESVTMATGLQLTPGFSYFSVEAS